MGPGYTEPSLTDRLDNALQIESDARQLKSPKKPYLQPRPDLFEEDYSLQQSNNSHAQ